MHRVINTIMLPIIFFTYLSLFVKCKFSHLMSDGSGACWKRTESIVETPSISCSNYSRTTFFLRICSSNKLVQFSLNTLYLWLSCIKVTNAIPVNLSLVALIEPFKSLEAILSLVFSNAIMLFLTSVSVFSRNPSSGHTLVLYYFCNLPYSSATFSAFFE